MRPSQVLAIFLAFSTLSSAWPWPPSLQNINPLTGLNVILDRRQNQGTGTGNSNSNNNNNKKPAPAGTSKGPVATPTSNGGSSSKGTTTAKNSKSSHKPTQKPISFNDFPGGVNMLQPAITSGSQYYRVDTTVTWVWNYTSLLRTPSHIDILATMGAQSAGAIAPSPFTLALNQSFAKTQTFTWDTGEYFTKTSQLPVGTYTLQIFDGDAADGSSARPRPGRLAPFNQFLFGMYTPTPYYLPVPQFQCITCNAAGGKMERLTWGFLMGTVAITMGSFIWFAGNAGVLF